MSHQNKQVYSNMYKQVAYVQYGYVHQNNWFEQPILTPKASPD